MLLSLQGVIFKKGGGGGVVCGGGGGGIKCFQEELENPGSGAAER